MVSNAGSELEQGHLSLLQQGGVSNERLAILGNIFKRNKWKTSPDGRRRRAGWGPPGTTWTPRPVSSPGPDRRSCSPCRPGVSSACLRWWRTEGTLQHCCQLGCRTATTRTIHHNSHHASYGGWYLIVVRQASQALVIVNSELKCFITLIHINNIAKLWTLIIVKLEIHFNFDPLKVIWHQLSHPQLNKYILRPGSWLLYWIYVPCSTCEVHSVLIWRWPRIQKKPEIFYDFYKIEPKRPQLVTSAAALIGSPFLSQDR